MDVCKESRLNRKIIDLMDDGKKEVPNNGTKNNERALQIELKRKRIREKVIAHINNLEGSYIFEADSVLKNLRTELEEKSKALDRYYKYCQRYKEGYAANFSKSLEDSKDYQKELEALKVEYLESRKILDTKREKKLEEAFVQFKENLIKTTKDLENRTFVDKSMKELVVDMLSLMEA